MPSDPLLQAIVGSTPAQEEEPAPEPRLRRAFRQMGQSMEEGVKGINRAMTTGLVGAPVDIINTVLQALDNTRMLPQRFGSDEPVGGSKWLHKHLLKAGLAHPQTGSPSEMGGEFFGGFLNPESAPMTLGLLVGARAMKNAPISMRAQYEAGRAALEAGEDPARVHRLYSVGKTKEGDYYFEPPLMQTEAAAIRQFENLYPDVKLRVLRNQGDRSGYFYPTKEGGEVFAQGRLDVPLENQHNRRRILEHELQHAVDSVEGRSVGDNPGVAYLQKPWSYRYQQYLNNAAEVRARATEVRLDPEMRQFPLVATEPVPREMQIVKQDPRAVAAAVKEPGGMWHPEAVDRLAQPLKRQLLNYDHDFGRAANMNRGRVEPVEGNAEAVALSNWSDRVVRNYLNKYAGTERDPLKDVEVPFGEGTKRWEELWDNSVIRMQGKAISPQAREGEIGYDFATGARRDDGVIPQGAREAYAPEGIRSYLSHVGDYLRQNVPPGKLSQYDLVRAVKETAANDARVAKQMAKAQADSTKYLPVHKEYPDGFKWVELRLPERLTEEQARQVLPNPTYRPSSPDRKYVAVGGDGKPIKNSYTEDVAVGRTPEEAWLAGRLAEEGNQMGHCVGGYCEPVASGESRIYSLRGPDGKSHVTVEVAPPDVRQEAYTPIAFYKQAPKEIQERLGFEPKRADPQWESEGDFTRRHRFWRQEIMKSPEFKQWIADQGHSILQIKGKQNRAPAATYLPYVQDFVKSGKWGEVGDLSNTGLHRNRKTGQFSTADELNAQNPNWRFTHEWD